LTRGIKGGTAAVAIHDALLPLGTLRQKESSLPPATSNRLEPPPFRDFSYRMRIREVTGVIAAKVGGSGPGGDPSEVVSPGETVSDNVRLCKQ